MKFNF